VIFSMNKALTTCLLIVGLINFVPLAGILSVDKLMSAYSITLEGNDIAILMRHRALLFGILGGFILFSAFKSLYQTAAMIMAGISMIGFALLVLTIGGYNDAIAKVLLFDIVGIVVLLVAVLLKYGFKKN